ncbi:MAG: class I SAM-dependent methyltransferase [Candidatus Latescibacterota bacterium]
MLFLFWILSFIRLVPMNEDKKFHEIDRLRRPERLARMELERVVDLSLADAEVHSVLDVGTGNGVFAEAFSLRGKEAAGLDESAEMIESAEKHVPRVVFRVGSAEALPWPDRSFDLVFMGLVLHEVDSSLTALREARRVARTRVAVLEWPYVVQEFGPPLSHRLRPGDITELALSAGFRQFEMILLTSLILYRLGV